MRSLFFLAPHPLRHPAASTNSHLRICPQTARIPRRPRAHRPPTSQLLAPADREIISLALPALGALALDPLLSLIDTAFVGRLGVAALAGTGIATLILNVSFSLFNFLCISITPLVASAIPVSEEKVSSVTANGLLLALFLGLLTATAVFLFSPPLVKALGATVESLPPAVTYLRIRAVAIPFALASFVANGALRGYRDLRTPFRIAVLANLLNVLLDIILIFPLGLGVAGAAIATSLSQIIAFLLMTVTLLNTGRLHLRHLLRIPNLRDLFPMLSAGAMFAIRTLSLLTTIAYATSTAASRGVIELAAYELCRQLWVFKATILDSLAAAAQALVATAVASQAMARARDIAQRTIRLSASFGLILGLAAIGAGTALPRIFTASPDVAIRAAACIKMAAVCAPLNGAVFALDGVLAACEDYRYLAGAIALASFVACAAITGVRVFGGSVVYVWAGLNMLMVARGAVLFWRFWGRGSPIKVREEKEA